MTGYTDALFDLARPPPIRKGGPGYLPTLAAGTYDGWTVWALAPIDRYVKRLHGVDDDPCVEFVWLTDGVTLHWALINFDDGDLIALDPRRIDQSIWHADEDPT